MANSDKNIIIRPRTGDSTNNPVLEFIGASSTLGPQTITATVTSANQGTVIFSGISGTILTMADNAASKLSVNGSMSSTGGFIGDLTGNADTATTWETARTITLGGDFTGSVSVDGSANVTLTGTVDATSANTANKIVKRDASGNFSAGTITANLSGNATTATTATNITAVANNSTSEIVYVTFVDDTTGSQGIETDTGLTYNPSTNTLTATTFNGDLSGNATTATTLQTARTIAIGGDITGTATSFNGSANISISSAITAGVIVNADINASAAIVDTKLATISTAGKVSNSATTATNATTANAIVSRDASGNFSAGTITAALSGNATTATTLQTARSINGVSFNGSANITVESYIENDDTTNATRYLTFVDNTTASFKRLNEDSNLTYNPSTNALTTTTFIGALSGNATTATTLQTTRTIGGVSFNGSANINLPGVNTTGNQNTTGSAASLTTARTLTIGSTGKTFNGTANVAWSLAEIGVNNSTLTLATSGIATGSQTFTSNQGTAATFTVNVPATNLSATAGTTAGPVINSSTGTNVTIPSASGTASGIVTTGTQTFAGVKTFSSTITGSVSGNAATATTLQNARTIGGVSFNGSANINLPGVNTAGNQNTSGTATNATNVRVTSSNTSSAFKVPFANTTVSTTGNYGLLQDSTATFTYNPSTNTLVAGTFSGSLSGNATTATTLQTARTINGTSFNGSANITTANWGTARTIWGTSINGSANVTGPVRPAAGSVSAPAFSTSGDTNTGIYFSSADVMNVTTGGTLAATFAANGNFTAVGDVTAFSDRRLKTNINTIEGALDLVNQLRGVRFEKGGRIGIGVIAQEIEEILPEVVNNGDEYKSVAYGNIVGVLIEAIKELSAEIEELKKDRQ